MTAAEIFETLRAKGTAAARATYKRHGSGDRTFGASFADIRALHKKLKTNTPLARELWQSGMYEARYLATLITDPESVDEAQLDAWARDLDNYSIADAFAEMVAKTSIARAKAEHWMAADDEPLETAGWRVLAQLAMHDASLPDSYFEPRLAEIESRIHTAKNRVRHQMNGTLIAIGSRSAAMAAKATAAATRIGKVHVDHGDTACKTPDAGPYIAKMRARKTK